MLNYAQPASTLDNLSRLASKPGVQSTLVLSKADGSIIHSSGLLAASSPRKLGNGAQDGDVGKPLEPSNVKADYDGITNRNNKGRNAEEVARMVFSFVSGTREFTEGMDDEDEVKLLRLRTRKNEIVIVPGQFLSGIA